MSPGTSHLGRLALPAIVAVMFAAGVIVTPAALSPFVGTAFAEEVCGTDPETGEWVCVDEEEGPGEEDPPGGPHEPQQPEIGDTKTVEAKTPACGSNGPPPDGGDAECMGFRTCDRIGPDGEEEVGGRYFIYEGTAEWDGSTWVELHDWRHVDTRCVYPSDDEEEDPVITPELVREEIRGRLPVSPTVNVEPPGLLTMVDLATIFYVDAPSYAETLTLLGQQVTVTATPVEYTWDYGDGSQPESTPDAGQSWNGGSIDDYIHYRYSASGSVQPTVAVSWQVTFQVGGGPVEDGGRVDMAAGDPVTLVILEKLSILSG